MGFESLGSAVVRHSLTTKATRVRFPAVADWRVFLGLARGQSQPIIRPIRVVGCSLTTVFSARQGKSPGRSGTINGLWFRWLV